MRALTIKKLCAPGTLLQMGKQAVRAASVSHGSGSKAGVRKASGSKARASKIRQSADGVRKAAAQPAITPFQQRLYALCKCVPAGKVTTYGILAAVLGSAARAVGQGMRRNPYAPVVPCHRVVASSLELGGFSGSWGLACESVQKKRRMLAEEGVPFDDQGRLADKGCLMAEKELRAAAAAAGVAV